MVDIEIRLITFFATKDGEALFSQQKQDQELTMAQIMNSLLPNSIPYDYTVGVTNRFKGLDLIDGVPEELRTEVHDTVEEAVIKTIPK